MPSAYVNKCAHCQQFLTNRAHRTVLIVDKQKVCYSVDFLSEYMVKTSNSIKKFELCTCMI